MQRIKELTTTYARLFPKASAEGTEESEEVIEIKPSITNNFYSYWGWQITLDKMTQGDATKEDEILDWTVIKFLNKLSYLKDKHDFEIEQIRLNGGR